MGSVAENIRAFRRVKGLTQQALADSVGVTRVTVAKWERGEIKRPRAEVVDAMCRIYHIKPDDIMSASRGIAAHELAGGEDPEDTSSLLLMELDGLQLRPAARRVEMPPSVVRAHPFGFAVESRIARVTGTPAACHVAVDPHLAPGEGSFALVRTPQRDLLLARLSFGRSNTMVSPLETEDSDDELVPSDEVQVLGVVVWWQAAAPMA